MSNSTSVKLLRRLGDSHQTQSWTTFMDLYEPFIDRQLRFFGLQGNDVDDVRQDVMLVLLQELKQFDHNGNKGAFRCWLRRVVSNQLRTHRRRSASSRGVDSPLATMPIEQLAESTSELAKHWDQEHQAYLIKHLLKEVEPRFDSSTLQAFRRQFIDGAAPAVVAMELERSTDAVISAKYRVLCALRSAANEYPGFG